MSRLSLELYFNQQNLGKLVLKTAGQLLRLERLENTLPFVASMHQLSKAIDAGARKDSCYELRDKSGKEWLLECRLISGLVDLQLWFEKLDWSGHLEGLFNWRGSKDEFTGAVKALIEKMPTYRFVW